MDLRKIKMLNILTVVKGFPFVKNYINISKSNKDHKDSLGYSSRATIEIDDALRKRLDERSKKTGFSEHDLANSYIFNGLNEDEKYDCKGGMTPEEIAEILDYDWPEGDWISKELSGLIENEYITNAVKLKKDSYK